MSVQMKSVESSVLARVGYDEDLAQLTVEFHNGKTTTYAGVSADTNTQMMVSPSIGSFYARNIKGKYTPVLTEAES